MTFQIEVFTKTKLTEVAVLSQKNREPGQNPGVALSFSMMAPNGHLSLFDGSLRGFLYTKNANSSDDDQGRLDIEMNELPNLTAAGTKMGKFHWDAELTGYELVIDHGIGGKSNLTIGDCKLDGFSFHPKEGGTVIMTFNVESTDVNEKVFGKLATLKALEVSILLTPPLIEAAPIE